jgi:hypothetical protein
VDGDYKLVVAERGGATEERFTRRGNEAIDVARDQPEIAAALRAKLREIRAKMTSGPPEIRQKLSPADREKLRALGYLDEP